MVFLCACAMAAMIVYVLGWRDAPMAANGGSFNDAAAASAPARVAVDEAAARVAALREVVRRLRAGA